MFAQRLNDAIIAKSCRVCVGIDPMYASLPEEIAGPVAARDVRDSRRVLDAYYAFVTHVLQIAAPIVPVVKFQSAYFEAHRHEGVEAYYSLIHEAHELGLLVIGDVKRGDIGSTSQAYAAGHLDEFLDDEQDELSSPDAITINPMLGLDSIEPFVRAADDTGKGLFVLVRTSNPGSTLLQDVKLETGLTWSEHLASQLHKELIEPRLGTAVGYCNIGAVVGATQPHTMRSLRARLPNSIFLLPGYGAQGATADMTRLAFDDQGLGAIVSASRSVLYPTAPDGDWRAAIRRAMTTMRDEVNSVFKRP